MVTRFLIKIIGSCLLFTGLSSWVYGENIPPISISEQPIAAFHHPNPRILDGFGMAVTQHRDQVLIGVPNAIFAGRETGVTHLFDLQGNLIHTFEIPTAISGALFGQAVALSEKNVIVGSPHGQDHLKTQNGVVYIFDRKTKKTRVTLHNPHPSSGVFGHALAVGKEGVLVGDPQASTSISFHSGAAYLFDETTGVLKRTFRPEEVAAGGSTQFGHAVALVGQHIFVSAPFAESSGLEAGIVYLFDATSGKLVRTFVPATPTRSLLFGWAFAANAHVIVIGAFGFQGLYREQGIAYVFDVESGKLLHILKNPSPTERAQFGKSVALFSEKLVVAAPGDRIRESGKIEGGAVYLFDQVSGTLVQTLRGPFPLAGASDVFGHTLSSQENGLLVGAPFGGIGKELDAGIVYQFHILKSL